MEANTCENAYFRMPNYVLSKAATPMNSHFERTMFIYTFCMDFAMQDPLKLRSTHPDMSRCEFIEHFTLKERCMAKSTPDFMRTCNSQSTLHGKLNTPWRNPALSITNVHETL